MSPQRLLDDINKNWGELPHQAKSFLLTSPHLIGLRKLIDFWGNPAVARNTCGGTAEFVCGKSWFLAKQYLKLGMVSEARALTLNGCFFNQCFHNPIETIAIIFDCPKDPLPFYRRGVFAASTPQRMAAFLRKTVPDEYQDMSSFVIMCARKIRWEMIDHISDGWKPPSNPSKPAVDDTQIHLILVDGTNGGQRHSFNIGSSINLKTLFNDYAEKRCITPISYHDKTLFLSSAGNKTPNELQMQDQDVINVHDTNVPQEPTVSESSKQTKAKKTIAKNRRKKTNGKGKRIPSKQQDRVKTTEEHKAVHSKLLTKLHEEVQPQLKEIRNRLNALDLERQPPKQQKKKNKRKTKVINQNIDPCILPKSEGKAGKSHFIAQVGEVENLYKTTKSCYTHHHCTAVAMIDLHGCTKNEALDVLNEKLPEWVDTAMKGEYPWVIPVHIVCGCGNQIVSEVVQGWIKSTASVRNAPKNYAPISRQLCLVPPHA
ncbi:hypothetical protein ACHAXR_012912 [Thalassiosira sp. AJA248-18]